MRGTSSVPLPPQCSFQTPPPSLHGLVSLCVFGCLCPSLELTLIQAALLEVTKALGELVGKGWLDTETKSEAKLWCLREVRRTTVDERTPLFWTPELRTPLY